MPFVPVKYIKTGLMGGTLPPCNNKQYYIIEKLRIWKLWSSRSTAILSSCAVYKCSVTHQDIQDTYAS